MTDKIPPISKCCKVYAESTYSNGTGFYLCVKCEKPCGIMSFKEIKELKNEIKLMDNEWRLLIPKDRKRSSFKIVNDYKHKFIHIKTCGYHYLIGPGNTMMEISNQEDVYINKQTNTKNKVLAASYELDRYGRTLKINLHQ